MGDFGRQVPEQRPKLLAILVARFLAARSFGRPSSFVADSNKSFLARLCFDLPKRRDGSPVGFLSKTAGWRSLPAEVVGPALGASEPMGLHARCAGPTCELGVFFFLFFFFLFFFFLFFLLPFFFFFFFFFSLFFGPGPYPFFLFFGEGHF